jgi:hypothetical protein
MEIEIEKTQLTWADLKEFVNRLSAEQLNNPLIWWGDDRNGKITGFATLEEDYIIEDGGEGISPKSTYDPEDLKTIIEEDEFSVLPQGKPILYAD